MSSAWRVRLTDQAELDLFSIATWTIENFGARQAAHYLEAISMAIEALIEGPEILGTRARDDLVPGIRTLHVARQGRKARHFVVFRVTEAQVLDVLRLLHESMDLSKHWPVTDDHFH